METSAIGPRRGRPVARGVAMTLALAALTGCVPNSSNPGVGVVAAQMGDTQAALTLRIENPSGRNLTVTRVDYELSEGDTGLPLAADAWAGELALPSHGDASLPLEISFDTMPLDPEATLLRLRGELHLRDRTGFLGIRSLDLTRTAFDVEFDAERSDP